jgi:hypothetical protein
MALIPAAWRPHPFSQLDLQRRVDPTLPGYDPAAERILLHLLGRGSF